MTLAEEQVNVDDNAQVTTTTEVCGQAKDMAQKLLNHYVRVQGQTLSHVCTHKYYVHMQITLKK